METPVLERLSPAESWKLIGQVKVGRLAVLVDGRVDIFPLNFVVDGNSVVFRTALGTKFWGAVREEAALEADGYDPARSVAWSAVVRGRASVISDGSEKSAADALQLFPWEPGIKIHYIRLAGEITGRRFKVDRQNVWNTLAWHPRTTVFQ